MKLEEPVVIEKMVRLYCRKNHGVSGGICPECSEILSYSLQAIDQCPMGENKPVCSACHIHCYKEPMRTYIRQVMRFSGPRMVLYHPIILLKYLFLKKKSR